MVPFRRRQALPWPGTAVWERLVSSCCYLLEKKKHESQRKKEDGNGVLRQEMECLVIKIIIFILVSAAGNFLTQVNTQDFVAGTFILTQKSLNEAPYRYAGVLRQVLDKIEQKDPPSQSDEDQCDAKYRILPSGNFFFNFCETTEVKRMYFQVEDPN